jgi:hypothetical protein
MIFTKSELHRRGDDVTRKGWTTRFYHDFLDSVWREPFINRTSGFDVAGGPNSVLAFDNLTRIFSISPVTNKFAFWQFIVRITFFKRYEPMELKIPDEEGLYLIYLFRDEEDKTHKRQKLFYTKNPTLEDIREVYLNRVIVSWIYWAYDLQEAIYFGDSRHGSEWPPQVHWSWHQTLNSLRESGIQIVNATYDGDGSENAHYQFGITAGTLWHEDMHTSVEAVSDSEALPVWYFDVAGNPRFAVSPGQKFLNAGRVAFNSATGGLIQATNNWFVVYHLFATNCKLQPVISVMGQAEFETLGAATGTIEAEVATLRQTLPHSNLMHIGSFILHTSDDYTNSRKARVVWTSSNIDTFTTELDFDEITRILTLKQNNNKPDLEVEIPGGEIADDYSWHLHSPEQIIGYLSEPSNVAVNVDGTGSITESVGAGDIVISAINAQGETTPASVPAFDILDDSTEAIISWDAVTGATAYRVYDAATGDYTETTALSIDYLTFSPATAGTVPTENTAAILQSPFTIANEDTIKITGEGIDVETSITEDDTTEKNILLKKQQSDWDEEDTESPNFILNKPEITRGGLSEIPFEFCIESGVAEAFNIDIYVTTGYTITKAILESDGTLNGVAVKINSTAITGLDNISVSTVSVFSATAANTAVEGNRVTIVTSGSDTGTPTIIRGKIVL